MDLERLKKEYSFFEKKYKLPSFTELNKYFDIERAADKESEFPLREIRRYIGDKITNYIRFVETILNPAGAPMFIFSLIKTMPMEARVILQKTYSQLARMDLEVMSRDVSFDEKKEAEFINSIFSQWKEIEKNISSVLEGFKSNWEKEIKKDSKSYFG